LVPVAVELMAPVAQGIEQRIPNPCVARSSRAGGTTLYGSFFKGASMMNKSDLIEVLAKRINLTQKRSESVINHVFNEMTETLKKNDKIEIRGFGSFTVKHYKPYVGRNPKTGDTIQVKEKRLPFFKVGRELKKRVDGDTDR
jgi:integration host factor subunit beta